MGPCGHAVYKHRRRNVIHQSNLWDYIEKYPYIVYKPRWDMYYIMRCNMLLSEGVVRYNPPRAICFGMFVGAKGVLPLAIQKMAKEVLVWIKNMRMLTKESLEQNTDKLSKKTISPHLLVLLINYVKRHGMKVVPRRTRDFFFRVWGFRKLIANGIEK